MSANIEFILNIKSKIAELPSSLHVSVDTMIKTVEEVAASFDIYPKTLPVDVIKQTPNGFYHITILKNSKLFTYLYLVKRDEQGNLYYESHKHPRSYDISCITRITKCDTPVF